MSETVGGGGAINTALELARLSARVVPLSALVPARARVSAASCELRAASREPAPKAAAAIELN